MDELLQRFRGYKGTKVEYGAIGNRNAGLPTLDDCLGAKQSKANNRGTILPLQPKPITSCHTHVLVEMAVGTPEELNMETARRVLEDVSMYANVPPVDLKRSSCTLNKEQVQYMIDIGMWSLLTPEEEKRIKGIVKIFTNDEHWKDPPRARVISWTWSINQDLGLKIPFEMFKQCGVRHLVHDGPLGCTIDGKSCFTQFKYSIDVGDYHAVWTPLGWCRLNRCAMGARPSCFVADTILRVLAQPCESKWKTYVDNLLMVGPRDTLRKDIALVKDRAEQARYIFNEDLDDPDALISEELEFLGALLNFEDKTVALGTKVLKKLATIWQRRDEWTVRDFLVVGSILVYGSNIVGRSMAPYQKFLKRWARAQGECVRDRDLMQASLAELPPEVDEQLEKWVIVTLINNPLPVPDKTEAQRRHDFVLITDACVDGWSGIIYSVKSGQCTVVRGDWPEGNRDLVKHSTMAEPLAVAASCATFFEPGIRDVKVLHIGDNTAVEGEINKGYSTSETRFLMEFMQEQYPGMEISSKYYPGEAIPTDEASRGKKTRKDKLDVLIEAILELPPVTDMVEIG